MSVEGVVVVDKARGPTSHDVVARHRRELGVRQIGHAGTLDPMATGVLVLAVGEATKLVPYLTAEDKTYEATLLFGVGTDTLDADGHVVERAPVPDDLEALLPAAIAAERARTEQVPPAYSAIRIGGERAHELARRGEAPALTARAVAVRSLSVLGVAGPEVTLALTVSKGYFVRSLARDLALAVGTVGHLTALRRTRSGAFTLDDAGRGVIPLAEAAARALPVSRLTDAAARAAAQGKRVPSTEIAEPHGAPSAWLDPSGRLVAVGEVLEDGSGRVLRGFPARA